jgi:hypothetical protein
MTTAIMVILLNIVTDMTPYFSILEIKFIEIFRSNADNILKRRRTLLRTAEDYDG